MKKFIVSILLVAALAAPNAFSQTRYTGPSVGGGNTNASGSGNDSSGLPAFWGEQTVTVTGKFFPKPGDPTLKSSDEIKSGTNSVGTFALENIANITWGQFLVRSYLKSELSGNGGNFYMGQLGAGWAPKVGDFDLQLVGTVSAPLAKWKAFQPGISFWAGNGFFESGLWANVDVNPFGVKQNVVSTSNVWSDGKEDRQAWALGGNIGFTWFGWLKTGLEGSYSYSNDLFGAKGNLLNPRYEIGGNIGAKVGAYEVGVNIASVTGGEVLPYLDKTSGEVKASTSQEFGMYAKFSYGGGGN